MDLPAAGELAALLAPRLLGFLGKASDAFAEEAGKTGVTTLITKIRSLLPKSATDEASVKKALEQLLAADPHLRAEVARLLLGSGPSPSLPTRPNVVLGRALDVDNIRARLTDESQGAPRTLVIHGSPGIGKTTLLWALAYDEPLKSAFPGPLLWTSLGPNAAPEPTLRDWSAQLALETNGGASELAARLRFALHDTPALILIDDAWEPHAAAQLIVGGPKAGHVVTTREPSTTRRLAPGPRGGYALTTLDPEDAFRLFQHWAPTAAIKAPREARELCRVLDNLPLAINIAAHLVEDRSSPGLDPSGLLRELRSRGALLDEAASVERRDANGNPLTVNALLALSTDRLDPKTRSRFGSLGMLAHEPAVFRADQLRRVWGDDADETIARLVNRGLMDAQAPGVYWMHALLSDHALRILAS